MLQLDTLQSRSLLISSPFTNPNQTKKQSREKLEKVFCVLNFLFSDAASVFHPGGRRSVLFLRGAIAKRISGKPANFPF